MSIAAILFACTGKPDDPGAPGPTTAEDTAPPPGESFDAPFLWAPLDLAAGVDLGHVPAPIEPATVAGPIVLTEVGTEAGLAGSVSGGSVYGVGLAFVDVDDDGWDDLVAINGHQDPDAWESALWRNRGDGTFEDVTGPSGLGAILGGRDGTSIAAADLDGDGDVDLYVGAHPTDVLLLNQGDGTFVDGTAPAGAGGPESSAKFFSSKIAAIGDYDGDGLLDVVSASDTFVQPGPNASQLRGTGGGTFADVTAATGAFAPEEGTFCAVMWSDHDADGLQDLVIWSDFGDASGNRVLLRSDGTTLTDRAADAGWTNAIVAPMGIDAADIDRDGRLDYFVGDGGVGMLLVSTDSGR